MSWLDSFIQLFTDLIAFKAVFGSNETDQQIYERVRRHKEQQEAEDRAREIEMWEMENQED